MKIRCPHCQKDFEYGLDDIERKLIFAMLMQDKDLMRKLGEEAAKAYFNK